MEKNKNLVGEEFGRECYHLKTFLVQHTSRPTDASSTVDGAGSLLKKAISLREAVSEQKHILSF